MTPDTKSLPEPATNTPCAICSRTFGDRCSRCEPGVPWGFDRQSQEGAPAPTGIEAANLVADYLRLRFTDESRGGDDGDAANIIHILHEAGVKFGLPGAPAPQRPGVLTVDDAMVERAWAAMVGSDVASICFNASIIRSDLRDALTAALSPETAPAPDDQGAHEDMTLAWNAGREALAEAARGQDWAVDQYWEYADGLLGHFVCDQMRAMLADRGLVIVSASLPSAQSRSGK